MGKRIRYFKGKDHKGVAMVGLLYAEAGSAEDKLEAGPLAKSALGMLEAKEITEAAFKRFFKDDRKSDEPEGAGDE